MSELRVRLDDIVGDHQRLVDRLNEQEEKFDTGRVWRLVKSGAQMRNTMRNPYCNGMMNSQFSGFHS